MTSYPPQDKKTQSIHLTHCIQIWQEHGLCQRFHIFTPLHFSTLRSFHTELRCFDKELEQICCLHAEKGQLSENAWHLMHGNNIIKWQQNTDATTSNHLWHSHHSVWKWDETWWIVHDGEIWHQLYGSIKSSIIQWHIIPAQWCETALDGEVSIKCFH